MDHPCLPQWRATIEIAMSRGYATSKEITNAGNWNTCAIGEAERRGYRLGKRLTSRRNAQLESLGIRFSDCFISAGLSFEHRHAALARADEILTRIEAELERLERDA
jgi:hypothetical protein